MKTYSKLSLANFTESEITLWLKLKENKVKIVKQILPSSVSHWIVSLCRLDVIIIIDGTLVYYVILLPSIVSMGEASVI